MDRSAVTVLVPMRYEADLDWSEAKVTSVILGYLYSPSQSEGDERISS